MKPPTTIKIKALFLLVTFSLNSVVGFACSVGVDMGFNSHHHHSHDSGKHHEHSDADNHHEHDGSKSHGHEHGLKSNSYSDFDHNIASFTSPGEDNCCKDFVVGFQNMDKMVAKVCGGIQQLQAAISPYIIPVITGLDLNKGFLRHFQIPPKEIDLPPPDIMIIVQSFLI